MKLFNLNIVP
jgi:hypothetical protein